MNLYPVIMCGGGGARLWPASRPSRPKQFINLIGQGSLFEQTVERVAPLCMGQGQLIVVAGIDHFDLLDRQLAGIGTKAVVILEPEGRDSAPAMAAAAAWVAARDPEGVLAFVASDHHIPDSEAFRAAILSAASEAMSGRIVTLGIRPTTPSIAYGYIRPEGPGLSRVQAFKEKPDASVAQTYIREGYLWNSGNFVVSARSLRAELDRYAPDINPAIDAAIPQTQEPSPVILGPTFLNATAISIDYAVMEKTGRASVLTTDLAWSDLGAWDAVAALGPQDSAATVTIDSEGCFVRAPDGMVVALVDVEDLAVIVESDAVLVTRLDAAQKVKRVVDALKAQPDAAYDNRPAVRLIENGHDFARWLRLSALPLWSALGQTQKGQFLETLSPDRSGCDLNHRARVQARQVQVYCAAGIEGWDGPWRDVAHRGLKVIENRFLKSDGLFRTLVDPVGRPVDDTAMLYDQAFTILAMATASRAGMEGFDFQARSRATIQALENRRVPAGGYREQGAYPYQANAHMHLLEATLAWEDQDPQGGWSLMSDEIAALAINHFVNVDHGCLLEFFDENWRPAAGADGSLVEPGHQFEWCWLLARMSLKRDRRDLLKVAEQLYDWGLRGVIEKPVRCIDALDSNGTPHKLTGRLWPQTEWLKASLLMAQAASPEQRSHYIDQADKALAALRLYLMPDGLWRDKQKQAGVFDSAPSPASSFYHIMAGYQQLTETIGTLWPGTSKGMRL